MQLEVKGLNTYYGESHVLQDMSVAVNNGEVVALLGRNGMGKSTTLKSIMGLVKPKSGTILFQGKNITTFPPYKTAKIGIGYVPEERRIFPNLSVLDNLRMGIKHGAAAKTAGQNKWTIDRIFEHFPFMKARTHQKGALLSGGEQQMLAIARGLMAAPKLMLLDEPSMGLAPVLVEQVFDTIEEINDQGTSILLVEQNAQMALSIADRAYVLETGKVVLEGKADEVMRNSMVIEAYLGG